MKTEKRTIWLVACRFPGEGRNKVFRFPSQDSARDFAKEARATGLLTATSTMTSTITRGR